jgi:hypothetical protein
VIKTEFPHYEHVEGWLHIKALKFTSYFADKFLSDTRFDSIEIGVHHGKFLIGIENLTPTEGRCLAVDVFSQQALNIDRSGEGSLEIFTANCARFAVAPERIVAIEEDSLNLDSNALGKGKFGIVSIDGGHTERHTVSDLMIAQDLVCDNGIVILDDILNQDWMGVISGACSFFSSPLATRLAPFAVGFGKLFCCHFSVLAKVRQTLAADQDRLREIGIVPFKATEFVGRRIVSLMPAPQPRRPRTGSSAAKR